MEQKSKIFQELLAMLRMLKGYEIISQETAVCLAVMLKDDVKADRWMDWLTETLHAADVEPTEKELIVQAIKIAQS